jgi:hypothetical protein
MINWNISYNGETKIRKDGSHVLEIKDFIFEGKFYKPQTPVKFQISEEAEGYIYLQDNSISVREYGRGFFEALENAIVSLVDFIELLLKTPDSEINKKTLKYKHLFETWEMKRIDRQAQ